MKFKFNIKREIKIVTAVLIVGRYHRVYGATTRKCIY